MNTNRPDPFGWRNCLLALAVWCALAGVMIAVTGCAGRGFLSGVGDIFGPPKTPTQPVPADPFWWLTWLAGLCGFVAVVALIASAFIPLIPRRAAWTAIACAIGCGVLKAFLAKFLGVLIWGALGLGLVAGGLALWPYLRALIGWSQYRLGKRLAHDDPRAGVAVMAAAAGKTRANGKDQAWRKSLLESVQAAVAAPKPSP